MAEVHCAPPPPPRPPILSCPEYVEVRRLGLARWRVDLYDGSPCYPRQRHVYGSETRADRIARRLWAKHLASKRRRLVIENSRVIVAGDA